jgi:hypothetical protein
MTAAHRINAHPMLHLRIAGHSAELPLATLKLDLDATDTQVKLAVGRYLDLSEGALNDYVVVRHTHTIVVRPGAVYG